MWIVTTPSREVENAVSYSVPLGHNATKIAVILAAQGQHIAAQSDVEFSATADVEWRSDRVTALSEEFDNFVSDARQYDIMASEGEGKWQKFKAAGATKSSRSYSRLDLAEKALESVASEYPQLSFRIEETVATTRVVSVALNGWEYIHTPLVPVQEEIAVETAPEVSAEETPEPVAKRGRKG